MAGKEGEGSRLTPQEREIQQRMEETAKLVVDRFHMASGTYDDVRFAEGRNDIVALVKWSNEATRRDGYHAFYLVWKTNDGKVCSGQLGRTQELFDRSLHNPYIVVSRVEERNYSIASGKKTEERVLYAEFQDPMGLMSGTNHFPFEVPWSTIEKPESRWVRVENEGELNATSQPQTPKRGRRPQNPAL